MVDEAARSPARAQSSSSPRSCSRSTGLTRWWSKPASSRAASVLLLAPAGQRDQRAPARPPGCSRSRAGDLVAVHARAGRCPAARPRAERARPPPRASRRRGRCEPSWPMSRSSSARLSARVELSSTTRMRQAVGSCLGPALGARAASRPRASGTPAGSRTMNSLPWLGPSLRASTVPPCSSTSRLHQRQADAQAALRALERRGRPA